MPTQWMLALHIRKKIHGWMVNESYSVTALDVRRHFCVVFALAGKAGNPEYPEG